jgi:hypothetical protein
MKIHLTSRPGSEHSTPTESQNNMTEIDKRIPAGVTAPIYRHSGTMVPVPQGKSDGNAGGKIPVESYTAQPVLVRKTK